MCVCVCAGWSIGWQTDWIHDGITDVTGGSEGGDPDPSGRPAAFRATGSVGQEGQGRWRRRRTVFSRAPTARPPAHSFPLKRCPDLRRTRRAGGKFEFLDLIRSDFLDFRNCQKSATPLRFPMKTTFRCSPVSPIGLEKPEFADQCLEFLWLVGGPSL